MFTLLLSSFAHAQSCEPLLEDLAAWADNDTPDWGRYIEFQMMGNRGGADWGQYTVGWLDYEPGYSSGMWHSLARLSGEAWQMFSDRPWYDYYGNSHPFSPWNVDLLGVSFLVDPLAFGDYGDLTQTALSWGGGTETTDTLCQGSYLYTFTADQMLVFTFKKVQYPIIR
jgi:hypothetical protein